MDNKQLILVILGSESKATQKPNNFFRSSSKVESFYCFICSLNGEYCVEMSINANVENYSIKNQQVEDKLSK